MRTTYIIWCYLRFSIGVFSQGYIHPDEFFQSPEVIAEDYLNFKGNYRPWEFNNENPCRTIVTPAICSGIPFFLLDLYAHLNRVTLNSDQVFFTPKLFMLLYSFVLDFCVYKIYSLFPNSQAKEDAKWSTMTCLSSSWVLIVFHTRTFSNAMESLLFAVAITLVIMIVHTNSKRSGLKYIGLGIVTAAGVFTRFTFILFAATLGIYMLIHLRSQGFRIVKHTVQYLFGLTTTTAFFVICDSLYFGSLTIISQAPNTDIETSLNFRRLDPLELFDLDFWSRLSIKGYLTYTPVNSFLYNMQVDNLARHGIHPRYLHALVNFPLLFGPLVLIFLFYIILGLAKYNNAFPLRKHTRMLAITIIVSLVLISFAPHQEPRFLVPLLFPMVLLCGPYLFAKSKLLTILWILFNCVSTLFFGAIHQGGVIPSIRHIEHVFHSIDMPIDGKVNLIFYHTYMPPRFILCDQESLFNVIDLGSSSTIDHLLLIIDDVKINETLVIAPSSLHIERRIEGLSLEKSFFPHLSTEDMPTLSYLTEQKVPLEEKFDKLKQDMSLNLYLFRAHK